MYIYKESESREGKGWHVGTQQRRSNKEGHAEIYTMQQHESWHRALNDKASTCIATRKYKIAAA